jgi:hypothetical protein
MRGEWWAKFIGEKGEKGEKRFHPTIPLMIFMLSHNI